jgi:K+-transporting ATPase ATPase A chain
VTADALFNVQLFVLIGIALLAARPLGIYVARVLQGTPCFALRLGTPLERAVYRICGIDSTEEMAWTRYARFLLVFTVLGAVVL